MTKRPAPAPPDNQTQGEYCTGGVRVSMPIDNAGRMLLGSLGDGVAALTHAHELAGRLAERPAAPASPQVAPELLSW